MTKTKTPKFRYLEPGEVLIQGDQSKRRTKEGEAAWFSVVFQLGSKISRIMNQQYLFRRLATVAKYE